jgi:glutamate synthase (ferredoxin)
MGLSLEGEANDHVAKGMSGGQIAIFPNRSLPGSKERVASFGGTTWGLSSPLAGNAVLYGATGGRLFVAGSAGERFAVRNSGALAVVEGVGDHGCEYMTAGRVAVLGRCGRNFGAGMSGGVAYVLDEEGTLRGHVNSEMVALHFLEPGDARELKQMIEAHRDATGSERAREILENWGAFLPLFQKVAPHAAAQPLVASPPARVRRLRNLSGGPCSPPSPLAAAESAGEPAAALRPNL